MFFPILRGKQNELLVLRELGPRIANEGGIIPIIEPVRCNASSLRSFRHFIACNLRFILILNPEVGTLNYRSVSEQLIEPVLRDYENYIPALRVDGRTTLAEIRAFTRRFEATNPELAFVFTGEPTTTAVLAGLISSPSICFNIFVEGCTSAALRNRFPQETVVIVDDCFSREDRNADYTEDEFFTDRHLPGQCPIAGFGNYSIVGSEYSEKGGPAFAVALHHVYFRDGQNSPHHIRHFVSDRTETPVDPAGKFLEALTKLVQALPSLGRANNTPTCAEYIQLHASQHFPGLGTVKKLAIKHHLELLIGR